MPTRRTRTSLHAQLTRAVFGPLCLGLSAALVAVVFPTGPIAGLVMAALWVAAAAWAFVQVQRCTGSLEHALTQATGAVRAMASGQDARMPAPTGVRELDKLSEAMTDLREYLAVMVVEEEDAPATASLERPAHRPPVRQGRAITVSRAPHRPALSRAA